MSGSSASPSTVAIAGHGGMAREAVAWVNDTYPTRTVIGFVSHPDTPEGASCLGLPVWRAFQELPRLLEDTDVVIAIGAPKTRARVAQEAVGLGLTLLTVAHPSAYVGPGVELGAGSLICPNVTLTRDVHVGYAVIVNYAAAIGHDCRLGDHAFIGPGATLGGAVDVGPLAYVGLGATILPEVRVGGGATIGAGAVVVHDVEPGTTVVGVPARPT